MPRANAGRAGRCWCWPTLLVLLLLTTSGARAQTAYRIPFAKLVDKSESIFVADCVDKVTTVSQGEIITRYRLRPVDVWKGAPKVDAAGELTVEELGGALPGPVPMVSEVTGQADIKKGEEVLLFTKNAAIKAKKAGAKPAPLAAGGTRLVGMNQGRYHVFKHPETGEKLVTHGEPSQLELKLANQAGKKAAAGQALDEADRNALQRVAKAGALSRERRDAAAKVDPAMADEIFQFEPLDQVKDRVQKHVGSGK